MLYISKADKGQKASLLTGADLVPARLCFSRDQLCRVSEVWGCSTPPSPSPCPADGGSAQLGHVLFKILAFGPDPHTPKPVLQKPACWASSHLEPACRKALRMGVRGTLKIPLLSRDWILYIALIHFGCLFPAELSRVPILFQKKEPCLWHPPFFLTEKKSHTKCSVPFFAWSFSQAGLWKKAMVTTDVLGVQIQQSAAGGLKVSLWDWAWQKISRWTHSLLFLIWPKCQISTPLYSLVKAGAMVRHAPKQC